jgi:hypothetical protein
MQSLRVGFDEYEQVSEISAGGQGTVFKVRQKSNGKIYAAKRFKMQMNDGATRFQKEEIIREVSIIQ